MASSILLNSLKKRSAMRSKRCEKKTGKHGLIPASSHTCFPNTKGKQESAKARAGVLGSLPGQGQRETEMGSPWH